jgi:hypothetical protein
MKKVFLFLMFLFLLAGWALAAASLHVVRTQGAIPKVGAILLVPKDRLTYRETYVDVSGWTSDRLANHPSLGRKIGVIRSEQAREETRQLDSGTFSLVVK